MQRQIGCVTLPCESSSGTGFWVEAGIVLMRTMGRASVAMSGAGRGFGKEEKSSRQSPLFLEIASVLAAKMLIEIWSEKLILMQP